MYFFVVVVVARFIGEIEWRPWRKVTNVAYFNRFSVSVQRDYLHNFPINLHWSWQFFLLLLFVSLHSAEKKNFEFSTRSLLRYEHAKLLHNLLQSNEKKKVFFIPIFHLCFKFSFGPTITAHEFHTKWKYLNYFITKQVTWNATKYLTAIYLSILERIICCLLALLFSFSVFVVINLQVMTSFQSRPIN